MGELKRITLHMIIELVTSIYTFLQNSGKRPPWLWQIGKAREDPLASSSSTPIIPYQTSIDWYGIHWGCNTFLHSSSIFVRHPMACKQLSIRSHSRSAQLFWEPQANLKMRFFFFFNISNDFYFYFCNILRMISTAQNAHTNAQQWWVNYSSQRS